MEGGKIGHGRWKIRHQPQKMVKIAVFFPKMSDLNTEMSDFPPL